MVEKHVTTWFFFFLFFLFKYLSSLTDCDDFKKHSYFFFFIDIKTSNNKKLSGLFGIHGSDARLSPAHFSPEVTMHHNLNNMTRDAVLTSDSIVGVPDTISVFFLPQSDLLR